MSCEHDRRQRERESERGAYAKPLVKLPEYRTLNVEENKLPTLDMAIEHCSSQIRHEQSAQTRIGAEKPSRDRVAMKEPITPHDRHVAGIEQKRNAAEHRRGYADLLGTTCQKVT